MDFFEAQDNARRKTWQLGLLFALALITLIGLTNIFIALVFVVGNTSFSTGQQVGLTQLLSSVPPQTWGMVSLGVVGVVGLACAYKYFAVRGGGRAIAESLGGRRIQSNSIDPRERRLLNVVEEMAIAAGIAVPPVYVIAEPGINAFAAGYTPDDAVIGITDGTLNFLSREELQGVIGHELSHIINGDTRINIRLIAILYGILFIGLIGNMLLRSSYFRGGRSDRGGGGAVAMILVGAGLAVIGYSGTFFGNLIKAAVSRQREFLADAAAVQFTRNPLGISGALQKIGSAGSSMQAAQASEISHMFFGQAIKHFLGSIMATHPPLAARIKAIDPTWSGEFPTSLAPQPTTLFGDAVAGFAQDPSALRGVEVEVDTLPDLVGRPNLESYETADAIIDTTNVQCLQAAHDPCLAHLLIYALLLSPDTAIANLQLDELRTNVILPMGKRRRRAQTSARSAPGLNESTIATVVALVKQLSSSDELHRLALVEIAVPALKQMSAPQYSEFVARVIALIKADRLIELFEWVLHRVLLKELRPHFEDPRPPTIRHKSIEPIANAAATLLTVLATHGHDSDADARAAFAAGAAELEVSAVWQDIDNHNFGELDQALRELRALAPLQKPKLLKGCAAAVLFDNKINPKEGALLQGISAALDCPLPPSVVAKPGLR